MESEKQNILTKPYQIKAHKNREQTGGARGRGISGWGW